MAAPAHPLIVAMIDTLPQVGSAFPPEARANWLKMMAMAFDLAYGTAEDMPAFLTFGGPAGGAMTDTAIRVPAKPEPPRPLVKPGPAFFIDEQGCARRGNGEPVNAGDVVDILYDKRGELGDLGAIIWADGSRGVKGYHLEISSTLP